MEVIEFLYLNGFSITKRRLTAENQGKTGIKVVGDEASNDAVEQSNTKTKTV